MAGRVHANPRAPAMRRGPPGRPALPLAGDAGASVVGLMPRTRMRAPAAGTQLGQVDGAPGAGTEVHADELLTAGGLAGDKQPRRHPAPPQGSAGACAAGAGPERRSCSTTAPRSSAARPPAPAALADAGPLGLPRRARRRPRPETSQPSHGVPGRRVHLVIGAWRAGLIPASLPATSPQRELPDRHDRQDRPNHARSAGC
jgi:hypothetical protein